MATCIKSRVSEHGDTIKHDLVEKGGTRRVSPSTTFHWLAFTVIKENCSVLIGTGLGSYCIVGTNHGAHAATDTEFCRIEYLTDTSKCFVVVTTLFLEDVKLWYTLAHVSKSNCTFWADSSALSAKGTSVLFVLNYPWKIRWC